MAHLKQKIPIQRILAITKRLYTLEKLQVSNLGVEYGVTTRTIYRDMIKISETIPLLNNFGIWHLDVKALGIEDVSLQKALLFSFAQNMEINIDCLEKSNTSKENIAFFIEYKHLPKKLGEQIFQALIQEKQCTFSYVKEEGTTQRIVDPIKIYTENSRWYVIARDHKDDKVKHFHLQKIKNFQISSKKTTLTLAMKKEADNIKSIWNSANSEEILVKLYVQPSIAAYIKDIKLHKTQTIYDVHHDGGLEVHCSITHKLELLPQIKYWLPRIYVLEPKWLHDELMSDLKNYREESDRFDI